VAQRRNKRKRVRTASWLFTRYMTPHAAGERRSRSLAAFAVKLTSDHLKVYGRAHDAEIWRDFETDMYKPDYSNWLYNARTAKDRPADLGYYIGYLITRAYYIKAKDQRQALLMTS
jgi:hypothetical protein